MSKKRSYTLKRGDILTIRLNNRRKKVEIASKKDLLDSRDRHPQVEQLLVGSPLFKNIEKHFPTIMIEEIKVDKRNVVRVEKILRT